jgi:signal transduction histidine kinase
MCACFVVHASTLEEAKAMVDKADAYMKANGKDKAIAEFNNPKGQFVKGDLYIIAQDYDGIMLANGGNPKLVGQNHFGLKDSSGKSFVKEMIEVSKTKGSGTVEYNWTNPVSKKIQPKVTYLKKADAGNFYIGCGFFK